MTLASAAASQQFGASGAPGTRTCGRVFVWYNPPTGTQALALTWPAAQAFGPCCVAVYVKDGDTSSWRDADAANAESTTAVTVTLTTAAGDLVLKYDQLVSGSVPSLSSGWTNGQTQA